MGGRGAGDHLRRFVSGVCGTARHQRGWNVHDRLCVGCACARGSLQYSDLVVKHWPKFAKEDPTKATITIADLLRHDSGLACFGTPAQHQYLTMVRAAPSPPVVALYCLARELHTRGSLSAVHPCLSSPAQREVGDGEEDTPLPRRQEGTARSPTAPRMRAKPQEHLKDPAKLSDFLERQPRIHYPKGVKRAYHGLYAGFHLNEVVRRADPQGRTIGTIVLQVSPPPSLSPDTDARWASERLALCMALCTTTHAMALTMACGRRRWCATGRGGQAERAVLHRAGPPARGARRSAAHRAAVVAAALVVGAVGGVGARAHGSRPHTARHQAGGPHQEEPDVLRLRQDDAHLRKESDRRAPPPLGYRAWV